MSKVNTFCWVDVPVVNLDRAVKFYTAILDKPVEKLIEGGFEFALFPHDDQNVSGCLVKSDNRKPSADGPMVYLNVIGRLEEAVSLVEKNGGAVISAKESLGEHGVRAIIKDTEGNVIALYSTN